MTVWSQSIASVLLVSLVSLTGVVGLSLSPRRLRQIAVVLVAFAAGALLGDAFIHLIPETFAHQDQTLSGSLLILGGMLLFFVVEKLLRHGHAHGVELDPAERIPHGVLATINIVGDAIHNFIDGVLIGASYLAGPQIGVSTTIAVLFHEIPQELGDFGVLVHSGLSVRRALFINLASASAAILGAVASLVAGAALGALVTRTLIPVAAGGFVYIATADLIPELQQDRSLRGLVEQAALMALGIAVMGLLALAG